MLDPGENMGKSNQPQWLGKKTLRTDCEKHKHRTVVTAFCELRQEGSKFESRLDKRTY